MKKSFKIDKKFVIFVFLLVFLKVLLFSGKIRYHDYRNYTRFVIEAGSKVEYTIKEGRAKYTVRIKNPLNFSKRRINSKRIESFYVKRENTFTEITINLRDKLCLKLNHFNLNSPFRIVLDIYDDKECKFEDVKALKSNGLLESQSDGTTEENAYYQSAGASSEIHYIVIDPGHGGSEYGAVGPKGVKEKDVVLSIAKYLKREIEGKLGLKVVLTRERDIDLSLEERAEIANRAKADLFVSIHCNASRNKKARGSETFILSLKATDSSARRTAYFENNPEAKEYKDEEDTVRFILWDMAQSAFLKESAILAELIQKELNLLLHTKDRGIKQAPFRVLVNVAMPAVLVETAFLSNPEEEKMLSNPEFQKKIAYAIFLGIKRYIEIINSR